MNKFTTHSPAALRRPAAPPGAPMALQKKQKQKRATEKPPQRTQKTNTMHMSGSQFETRTYAYALHILLCMYVLTKLISRKMRLIFSNGQSPSFYFLYPTHLHSAKRN